MSSDVFRRGSQAKKMEVLGVESELREKKNNDKMSRELQEAPAKLRSQDLSTLSSDYELPRGRDGL